jgi:hypothetical protein
MTKRQEVEFNTRPAGTVTVRTERLDDYVRQNAVPRPNLIKLDVQGCELQALRGAEQCLSTAGAIISEVSFAEFYKEQCLFEDVVGFLSAHGFRTSAFGASTKVAARILQTDVLFERPSNRNS